MYDPASIGLSAGTGGDEPAVGNRPLPLPEVVVPRIGHGGTNHALAVLRSLEAAGVPATSPSRGIEASRDKMRCLSTLSRRGVPVPPTTLVSRGADVAWAVERVGGPPVVLKFLSGTHGVGVFLAESIDAVKTVLEAMWEVDRHLLVQQFVRESAGKDLRLFVVGDDVPAAIRRTASAGSFRANVHGGGRASAISPSPELRDLAVLAARSFGLGVAGVDLLEGSESPFVSEVNSSPGLEGIEDATGVDLAGAIADLALSLARKA